MKSHEFTVIGSPRPQARPRAYNRGKFSTVVSPTTDWKEAVKYRAVNDELYFEEAIMVQITYHFKRPKSHYGTGKNASNLKLSSPKHCTNKYDLDNLDKAILDAMQDAGLIKDDKYIVELKSSKHWSDSDSESATIYIEEV